ncbi:hypothetical protein GCM10009566_74320 [Streptomyces murinus]
MEVVPAGLRHAADALLKIGQNTVKVAGSALGGISGFTAGLVAGAALALLWKPRRVGVVVCTDTGSMDVPPAAMAGVVPLSMLVVATGEAGTGLAVGMTVWASLVQERIPADRLGRTVLLDTRTDPARALRLSPHRSPSPAGSGSVRPWGRGPGRQRRPPSYHWPSLRSGAPPRTGGRRGRR